MRLRKQILQKPFLLASALLCLCTAAIAAEEVKTTAAPLKAKAADSRNIVARVNDNPIYGEELERAQKVYLSGQPDLKITPERKTEFDKHVLNQLISAELLYQGGQKLEIKDMDKKIEAKIFMSKKRFKDEQEFEKSVKSLGMSPAVMREYTRRDIVITNFVQSTIVSKVTVSEDEIKTFYDQNSDKFKQGETVRASHILIGVDDKASAEEKKKAQEKAEKLRKEIAGGADFSALAKDNSSCPSSKQGGDLGYFGKGQMVPPFEQAAFALKVGDVSNVVETQFGYHIIKLLDRKSAQNIAYKEARPRLEEYLKGQKINTAVKDYLADARKNAKIEVLLN